ncbi:MAG TPA: hypothetical protein EYM72_01490 [Gammaproteobacteria bacterium]|nr:hypothetical protein [Gammaproteobacteria bacterium]
MKNPLDRLSWVRERVGLNSKAFAESIGLTAAGLHNMFTRKSRVTEVLANSVELVHGIRAQWLLSGEGLRNTDHHTLLDASEQALLECIKYSQGGNILLGEFVLKELEDEIESASVIYGRWLSRTAAMGKHKEEEWAKFEKLRIKKEKLRLEIWDVLNNLREGDVKQIVVDPLLLAIHFKDRWKEIRERSADYKQMQSFGLQPDFDEAYLTLKKIVEKMKGLFRLTNEQKKILE